jgi:hypothetical protein
MVSRRKIYVLLVFLKKLEVTAGIFIFRLVKEVSGVNLGRINNLLRLKTLMMS